MADEPNELKSETPSRAHWLLPLLGVAALVVIIVARFQHGEGLTPSATDTDQQDSPEKMIQVEIDYGDGVRKQFTDLRWHADMTVADAMELASGHKRGIRYTQEGASADALLVSIDDCKNEGGGSSSRNWIYRVNGVQGDVSFAVYKLDPWDNVLWSFTTYE